MDRNVSDSELAVLRRTRQRMTNIIEWAIPNTWRNSTRCVGQGGGSCEGLDGDWSSSLVRWRPSGIHPPHEPQARKVGVFARHPRRQLPPLCGFENRWVLCWAIPLSVPDLSLRDFMRTPPVRGAPGELLRLAQAHRSRLPQRRAGHLGRGVRFLGRAGMWG